MLPQKAKYFTLVREPISRLTSHYYFIQKSARNPNTKGKNYKKIDPTQLSQLLGTSLDQFVDACVNKGKDNHQTRILAGQGGEPYQGEVTTETLNRAQDNIRQHFAAIGTIENFTAFLLFLQKTLGWKNTFFKVINQNLSKPKRKDIESATLDRIKNVEQFDIKLYNFIVLLMEERIRHMVPVFRKNLLILRQ